MYGVSPSVFEYSTEVQKSEELKDPLVRFAVGALGGEIKGLSFVSYLTVEPEIDTAGWRLDPETGEITTPTVEFYLGGSLAKASNNQKSEWERKPGKRGQVDPNFSKGARRRMMRLFGTINRPSMDDAPLFITVTYPGKPELWEPFTPDDWKRHLDTWFKRVKRAWPNASAIWRLEPQKRGAPHYHLVVWGVWEGGIPKDKAKKREWKALTEWVSRSWWEVVGSGCSDHLKAGTSTEVITNWKRLIYYVSKYMAKVGVAWPEKHKTVGRLWGILGRDDLPWAELLSIQVTYDQATKLIRLFRKWARLGGKSFNTLTVFLDASFWHSKLSGMLC